MSLVQGVENFFESEFKKAEALFDKESPLVKSITLTADTYVNTFKNLEEGSVGQFLEGTIESVDPALTPAIKAVHDALPKILTDLNLAVAEENKPDSVIVSDGLAALNKLKSADGVLYAGILNTLNAKVQTIIAEIEKVVVTVQEALTIAPAVHASTVAAAK